MAITQTTVKQVWIRSRWRCECWCLKQFDAYTDYPDWYGPELHHIYWRSEYRWKDRDEARNLALLYWPHHKTIHNGNFTLDKELKAIADIRKPKEQRSTEYVKRWASDATKQLAKQQREKALELFKEKHWWLTPSQYKAKNEKKFFTSLRRK